MDSNFFKPFQTTIYGFCPQDQICQYIQYGSEGIMFVLILNCLFFLFTLIPPFFSWSSVKNDDKKRPIFAAVACFSFYFWISFLLLNTIHCFGFISHRGPCLNKDRNETTATETSIKTHYLENQEDFMKQKFNQDNMMPTANEMLSTLSSLPSTEIINKTNNSNLCVSLQRLKHESKLTNVTIINILITVTLLVILTANANEAFHVNSVLGMNTLFKKQELQQFLHFLTQKQPEVGHVVKCFHLAKAHNYTFKNNSLPTSNKPEIQKITTFSSIANFHYNSWKDFSDHKLVEPNQNFPVIEVKVVLNFFPGDHYTAEKYKAFVNALTKEHSDKDTKISIDDYFHIEDHREWNFRIGNRKLMTKWWEILPLKIIVSCILLFGWLWRIGHHVSIGHHKIEIKKAVFCEEKTLEEVVEEEEGIKECSKNCEASNTAVPVPVPVPAEKKPTNMMKIKNKEYYTTDETSKVVKAQTHYVNGLFPSSKDVVVETVTSLNDVDVQLTTFSGYETYV